MKKTLSLLLALVPLTGFADDKGGDAPQLSPASRAERLSDVQLDQIIAGKADTVLIVFNPGQSHLPKEQHDSLHCINCLGSTTAPGDTFRILIVNNPAKSFSK